MATPREIRAWWDDPVADMYRAKMRLYIEDFATQLRVAVDAGDLNQAMGWNARLAFAEELLDFKDEMIDESEGEDES